VPNNLARFAGEVIQKAGKESMNVRSVGFIPLTARL
jgi:hypothetical protein